MEEGKGRKLNLTARFPSGKPPWSPLCTRQVTVPITDQAVPLPGRCKWGALSISESEYLVGPGHPEDQWGERKPLIQSCSHE